MAVVELHPKTVAGGAGRNVNAGALAVPRWRDGAEPCFAVDVIQIPSYTERNITTNAARHQTEKLVGVCVHVVGGADTHVRVQIGLDDMLSAKCDLLDREALVAAIVTTELHDRCPCHSLSASNVNALAAAGDVDGAFDADVNY